MNKLLGILVILFGFLSGFWLPIILPPTYAIAFVISFGFTCGGVGAHIFMMED